MKLRTFDIRYKSRNSIKGQVLADFVAEFTPSSGASLMICQVIVRRWKVYMDGTSNARGSRIEVVMVSPKGIRVKKSLRLGFRASNIEAEYEALIAGLRAAQELEAKEVEVVSNSRLVVSQVNGSF